jgi:hypothetical protein
LNIHRKKREKGSVAALTGFPSLDFIAEDDWQGTLPGGAAPASVWRLGNLAGCGKKGGSSEFLFGAPISGPPGIQISAELLVIRV